MNPLYALPFLALFTPVAPSSGDVPALNFSKGQTLTQTWDIKAERSTESATFTIQENEQDLGSGSTATNTSSMEIVDRVLEAKDGGLTKFSRTFESLGSSRDVEGFESSEGIRVQEGDETSALQGQEVIFTFDADADEYERAFGEDSEGEDDWLDELVPNSYLPGLLPEDEVAAGDTWEVDAAFARAILRPLGEVNVEEGGDDPDVPEGGIAVSVPSPDDAFDWAEIEGEIKARWAETDEEDGKRVAKIVVAVELSGTYDLSDALEEASADRGAEETFDTADYTQELEGELVVLWDLANDRPVSLEGTLEGSTVFEALWTLDAGVMELELATDREASERYEIAAQFSAE